MPFSFTKTLTVFQPFLDTQDARRKRVLNRKAETTAFLKVGIAKCVGCALLALACVISLKREIQDVYDNILQQILTLDWTPERGYRSPSLVYIKACSVPSAFFDLL